MKNIQNRARYLIAVDPIDGSADIWLLICDPARVTRRQERELAVLFRKHGQLVFRRAMRILGNSADAEEATQEIFIKVMHSKDRLADRESVVGWLYRITTNHCLNQVRDRKRRRELYDERRAEISVQRPETEAPKLLLLRKLLATADPEQAQAAIYVHFDGLSQREAADLMSCSRRHVGNLLERFTAHAKAQVAA